MKSIVFIACLLLALAAPALDEDTTFSSPAGGEVWVKGSTKTITYTFAKESPMYEVCLFRNGAFVGYVSFHTYVYVGVQNEPWQVGKIMDESEVVSWAPVGSGYTLCVGCWGSGPPPYGHSNPFAIGYDFTFISHFKQFVAMPKLGCPECFILDLKDLRAELVKLDEQVTVGLYWRNEKIANFGKIGKGQGWPAKQEIWLQPGPKTSMSRGGEFELRIFTDHHQLIHSQPVVLVAPNR